MHAFAVTLILLALAVNLALPLIAMIAGKKVFPSANGSPLQSCEYCGHYFYVGDDHHCEDAVSRDLVKAA